MHSVKYGILVSCSAKRIVFLALTQPYSEVGQGGTTKSDLEHQGQIRYSLGFEELGLGFGGE